MILKLSEKCEKIPGSKIREMFRKAGLYSDVIDFTIGEPDFVSSQIVNDAAYNAIITGKEKYTENAGVFELRKLLSVDLQKRNGRYYDPERQIIITPGAMGALFLAFRVILNKDDEVILSNPTWTNYKQQIEMNDGIAVFADASEENDFMIETDKIEQVITERTKAILINSPANPTGGVLDRNTLLKISEIAQKHNLIVIADETYRRITYDGEICYSIGAIPGMEDRALIIDSFSKSNAMTGWRVGYAAGPDEIIQNMVKFQENISACVAEPSQYAAIAALKGDDEHINRMVAEYEKRRNYICDRIDKIDMLSIKRPKGAFYAFINVKETGLSSDEFVNQLFESKHVLVVPGTAFGGNGEGYIRMSYATDIKTIKEGLDRIEAFVEELQ